MNINDLTIGQLRELTPLINGHVTQSKSHGFEVGKAYFIRSVTHHYLGRVIEIYNLCIVMEACVWVADDGRFHKLMGGEWDSSSEREPYGKEKKVQIFFGGMLDATEWSLEIPTSEK